MTGRLAEGSRDVDQTFRFRQFSPDSLKLASFTNAMLDEGTASRSALGIADDLSEYGATLSKGATTESSELAISALTNNAGPAMDIMADVAQHPAFSPEEIERQRAQRLTELMQIKDEPFQVALTVTRKQLFGPDNPLGHIALGTPAANKAISRDDLQQFYTAHYGPKDSALVLVGDMTQEDARKLAEKYFGGWSAQSMAPPVVTPPALPTPHVYVVDMPDSPSSVVLAVGRGIRRKSPDYAATDVMNSMLGGLFSSRINMNLREAHGYTYGAFSAMQGGRTTGIFFAGAEVRSDVTAPSVEQLTKELNRIRTEPLTTAELKMSKDSNVQSLPGEFVTTGEIAGAM